MMDAMAEIDVMLLTYVRGALTSIYGIVEGADVASTLFAIWLGDPPNNEIKAGLLGGGC